MKKILFTSICLVAMSVQNVIAQSIDEQYIYLLHEGNTTLFRQSKLQDAFNAAVKGDTVVLSPGTFDGNATIKTAITVMGAGVSSYVKGTITVNIPYKPKLTATFLMNLRASGVKVEDYVEDMIISKCQINDLDLNSQAENAVVISSRITKYLKTTDKNTNIINSYVYQDNSGGMKTNSCVNFLNCNIRIQYPQFFSGQLINCIVYANTTYSDYTADCMARNCLMNILPTNNLDCYQNLTLKDNDFWLTDMEGPVDEEKLTFKEYFGTDGKVVGYWGGDAPYSLESTSPKFVEEKLEVDNENETVKVTIKMSAN